MGHVMNTFKSAIKRFVRKTPALEAIAYLAHNNLLYRWVNFSGDGDFSIDRESIDQRCRELAAQYTSICPVPLAGKTVLEIGTGRSTLTAHYFASMTGAARVYTYDSFEQVYYHIDKEVIERRFPDAGKVTYLHGPDGLAKIDGPVDFIFSNAVLEHAWNTRELADEMERLSGPGTVLCHAIDFRSHNRFDSLGPLYFHTFSEKFWHMMASRTGMPNRLLISDYRNLFRERGFSFEVIESTQFTEEEVNRALSTYLKGKFPPDAKKDLGVATILVRCQKTSGETTAQDK
jgi:hypothetical protein